MSTAAPRRDRLVEILWYLPVAAGVLFILAYAAISLVRARYPYHLEWMEGGSLHHVQWILEGHPLYARPSLLFTPYTYPPLYYYVSAGAAALLGDGFFPLRLVSVLSSLGCFGVLFLIVRRETGSAAAAVLAAALFAATFRIGGAWFDLARVDSLFLLLLLAGVYCVRFGASNRAAVAAAALLTLACLTKQTALAVIPALALGSLVLRPRWSLRFLAALAALGGLAALLLTWRYGGWFRFYVIDLPAGLQFIDLPVSTFLRRDVLASLWIALAIGLAGLASLGWRPARRRAAAFYFLLGAGVFVAAYVGRNKLGGFLNALQPVHAYLALLLGLAAGELRAWLRRPPAEAEAGGRGALRQALAAGLCLAILGQLALLAYDPRLQLPSRSDRGAGDRLVALLRSVEGEVLAPEFNYLPTLAGKRAHAHAIATWDVMRSGHRELGRELLHEQEAAMSDGRFAAILLAQEEPGDWLQSYSRRRITYRLIGKPRDGSFLDRGMRWEVRAGTDQPSYGPDQDVFLPLIGYQVRPELFYTLKP